LKDSAAQRPLQYATVELFRENQTATAIRSVYTNDKGRFLFNAIDTGNYILVFSHTSFAEKKQDITVTNEPLDLREIGLSPASRTLQGAMVTAKKPLVEQL